MPADGSLIIRAVLGDAQSLAHIASPYGRVDYDIIRFIAVLSCERDLHPLAALTALAVQHPLPPATLAAARAALPAAIRMLMQEACDDLRASLRTSLPSIIRERASSFDAASLAALAELAHAAKNDELAIALMQTLRGEGWRSLPSKTRKILLQTAQRHLSRMALHAAALWDALTAKERERIITATVRQSSGEAAASLMFGWGAQGWQNMSDAMRQALLQKVAAFPLHAAHGGGAVWMALTDDERDLIARKAAQKPDAAVELMIRIGSAGWNLLPPATQQPLVDAVCFASHTAAHGGGAVWSALKDEARDRIAVAAARHSCDAAHLMQQIGAWGWGVASETARHALLRESGLEPLDAADGGGAVWMALAETERMFLVSIVAPWVSAPSQLMRAIGAAGWTIASPAMRESLLHAVCADPWHAAKGGAAVWDALNAEERDRIVRAAAQRPAAASQFTKMIGRGWQSDLSASMRDMLLHAALAEPNEAAVFGECVWSMISSESQAKIVAAAAQDASAAARLLSSLGVARDEMPPPMRDALLAAVAHHRIAAAKVLAAIAPDLSDGWRHRLLRTACADRDASLTIAQALQHGEQWRDWMLAFAPDADADADLKAAWMSCASRLPPARVAALLARRASKR